MRKCDEFKVGLGLLETFLSHYGDGQVDRRDGKAVPMLMFADDIVSSAENKC